MLFNVYDMIALSVEKNSRMTPSNLIRSFNPSTKFWFDILEDSRLPSYAEVATGVHGRTRKKWMKSDYHNSCAKQFSKYNSKVLKS